MAEQDINSSWLGRCSPRRHAMGPKPWGLVLSMSEVPCQVVVICCKWLTIWLTGRCAYVYTDVGQLSKLRKIRIGWCKLTAVDPFISLSTFKHGVSTSHSIRVRVAMARFQQHPTIIAAILATLLTSPVRGFLCFRFLKYNVFVLLELFVCVPA